MAAKRAAGDCSGLGLAAGHDERPCACRWRGDTAIGGSSLSIEHDDVVVVVDVTAAVAVSPMPPEEPEYTMQLAK